MNGNNIEFKNQQEQVYFLSEVIGARVLLRGPRTRRIGKLADFLIVDKDKIAEVTHLYIVRPFGSPSLIVPWEKVASINNSEIIIEVEDLKRYEGKPEDGAVLLKDYILDKKVLDTEDREVEIVYDVKMVLRNNKLYVSDVDLSRYGLLRRIGLKWLANFIYTIAGKIKNQTIPWTYVQTLPTQIGSFKGDLKLKVLKERLSDIPPIDLADILEELDRDQRIAIFDELDTGHASDTLEELDPKVQRDLIAHLKKDRAAQLINEMTPGQAADILSILPWWEVKAILKLLNKENAIKIESILEKQEEWIINFSISDFIKLTPDKTVLQARRGYQRVAKGKDVIMYLYIIDDKDTLLGVIDIKELFKADDEVLLKDIMVRNVISFKPETTLKEASVIFARYSFRAIPITDKNNKLIGVIPYRDVMNLKHLFI